MTPASDDDGRHGLRHAGDDAFQLTVDYLKQETIQPLRGLGRYLSMGILAAFFVAIGLLLILVGILRLLQNETGSALTGNWSWVPYAVVVFLGIVIVAYAAYRVTAGPAQPKLPDVQARRAEQEAVAGPATTQQQAAVTTVPVPTQPVTQAGPTPAGPTPTGPEAPPQTGTEGTPGGAGPEGGAA